MPPKCVKASRTSPYNFSVVIARRAKLAEAISIYKYMRIEIASWSLSLGSPEARPEGSQ